MSAGEVRNNPSPDEAGGGSSLESKPLVSVLMITYNHEPYIEQAIQSVLDQQTTFPFELVIGEDCSTDRTGEIVRAYAKQFPEVIRLITSSENVGGRENARRVRDAAVGKYFAWCEGDDWWKAPYKLQAQVDVMNRDSDVGLVYCDHDRHLPSTGITTVAYIKSLGLPVSATPDAEDILSGRAGILTCTVLARADLVRQMINSDPYLYSTQFRMADTQLWAEIALASKVHFIAESMSVRNALLESASRSRDESKATRFLISGTEMRLYLCEKHSLSEELASTCRNKLRRLKMKLAFLEGDAEATRQLLRDGERSLKDLTLHLGTQFKVVRWPLLLAHRLRKLWQPQQ